MSGYITVPVWPRECRANRAYRQTARIVIHALVAGSLMMVPVIETAAGRPEAADVPPWLRGRACAWWR